MAMMRPALRYHGSKFRIASWLIALFPEHSYYVEPFGGSGSVMLQKPPSRSDVYNDLDGEIVNVFRVLQDLEMAQELCRKLYVTPFARAEYDLAFTPAPEGDLVEQARRTIFRSFAAYGSTGAMGEMTGFRARSHRARRNDAEAWSSYPSHVWSFVERFRTVTLECRPAIDVMRSCDTPDTLCYLDPPYMHHTRQMRKGRCYRYELEDEDHVDLAQAADALVGSVAISGYPSDLYRELYADWEYHEREARDTKGNLRLEGLWVRKSGAAAPVRLPQRGQLRLGIAP